MKTIILTLGLTLIGLTNAVGQNGLYKVTGAIRYVVKEDGEIEKSSHDLTKSKQFIYIVLQDSLVKIPNSSDRLKIDFYESSTEEDGTPSMDIFLSTENGKQCSINWTSDNILFTWEHKGIRKAYKYYVVKI